MAKRAPRKPKRSSRGSPKVLTQGKPKVSRRRKAKFSALYAVSIEHPAPKGRPRHYNKLVNRGGYPFPDRKAALRIVAASTRAALPNGEPPPVAIYVPPPT